MLLLSNVYAQIVMVEFAQRAILVISDSKSFRRRRHSIIGRRISKPKCAVVRVISRKQCRVSEKSSLPIQLTISRHYQSFTGRVSPKFENLDARIATALKKLIQNSNFDKKVLLEEWKDQNEIRFLRGRQIALRDPRVLPGGLHVTMMSYSMKDTPHDQILECLYKMTIWDPERMKTAAALQDQDIEQKESPAKLSEIETPHGQEALGSENREPTF